ncbi:MAG: NAD(P)H-hydrate dehydratase, partial [Armatimonadota bacterium]
LASGGTGDVLSGMIGAFLAGGVGPLEAAVAATFYHGRAADLVAQPGLRGLVASDLVDMLPTVFPPA